MCYYEAVSKKYFTRVSGWLSYAYLQRYYCRWSSIFVSGEVSSIQRYNGQFRLHLKRIEIILKTYCTFTCCQFSGAFQNRFSWNFLSKTHSYTFLKQLNFLILLEKHYSVWWMQYIFFETFLRSLIFKFGHILVSGTFQINSGNDVSKTGSVLTQHNNVGQR